MQQQENDGVQTVITEGHYAQAASGYLVQTDEQGDGNAETAWQR